MTAFIFSVRTRTPVLLNRWLTLDAILDGMQEQDGMEPDARTIPLLAYDGVSLHQGLTSKAVHERKMVFCGSAAIPSQAIIDVDERISETRSSSIAVEHPGVSSISFKGGVNPNLEFPEQDFPFGSGRRTSMKFDIRRGPTGAVLRRQRMIHPGKFEWLAQGDPDKVAEIFIEAGAFGAKTRNGFGEIIPDSVHFEELPDAPTLFGIVDETGERLMRPTPAALFTSEPPPFSGFHHRVESCCAPYWSEETKTHALVPKTIFESLLNR
jgi:hypothetical protein